MADDACAREDLLSAIGKVALKGLPDGAGFIFYGNDVRELLRAHDALLVAGALEAACKEMCSFCERGIKIKETQMGKFTHLDKAGWEVCRAYRIRTLTPADAQQAMKGKLAEARYQGALSCADVQEAIERKLAEARLETESLRPLIKSYQNILRAGRDLVASAFAHVSHGGPTRADAEKWLDDADAALGPQLEAEKARP
jgi:hypothetical protein